MMSVEFKIGNIPEDSKLADYLKDFSLVVKREKDIDDLIRSVFIDSQSFLEEKLNATFPTIILRKCYNSKDFDREWEKTGSKHKKPTAFIIHSSSLTVPAQVVIDLQTLLSIGDLSFVLNFVLNIFEELLHSAYPSNNEQQTHDLLYPLAEKFLGIKLPDEYKNFPIEE